MAVRTQSFGSDPIAEVYITASADRAFREPGIEFAGLTGLPVWDGNPEVFELDVDRLGLPGEEINAGSTFSAIGVIGYEFRDYELWPTSLTVNEAPLPVAVRARTEGEFTVGSLNGFRLFDTDSDYSDRLTKFALYIDSAMDCPDILAMQEVGTLSVLDDLAAAVTTESAGTCSYTATYLIEGNDVGGIDVGFMVRDTVTPDATNPVLQLGADEILAFDGNLLHDRPPLLFYGTYTAGGPARPIGVLNLHNRSLSGIDGSSGERIRQKRLEQAESVARMVQSFQDEMPGAQLVVVGDFNAFQFTDGYVDVVGHIAGDFDPASELICDTNACPDLVEPNLTVNLPLDMDDWYSFIFRGNAQILDHALSNLYVDPFINEMQFARGNADASVINDIVAGTPLRSSDHDGMVLFIEADDDGVPADMDLCPATVIPEVGVPTKGLKNDHHALVDGDLFFDTEEPNGNGPGSETSFTIFDTMGCSCEQIIEALGLGNGHRRFGCTTEVIEEFIALNE